MTDANLFGTEGTTNGDRPAEQNTGDQPAEGVFGTLVGEDKKFKSPEDLAKSVAFKDEHIAKLERENAELRESRIKAEARDEVYEKLGMGGQRPPEEEGTATQPQQNSGVTLEQVKAFMDQERAQDVQEANIQQVTEKMYELYGEKAQEVVGKSAADMGLSAHEMQDLASKNPEVFYRVMGIRKDEKPVVNPNLTSTVNTAGDNFTPGQQGPQPGSYEYWENMRRTNKRQYYSPKMQTQYMKDVNEGRCVIPK